MSALDFLVVGGIAYEDGDLVDADRKLAQQFVKEFANAVSFSGRSRQVPASLLTIMQAPYLFVAKDTANFHFIFVDSKRANTIIYRDISSHGRVTLEILTHHLRIDVGDVLWGFSIPLGIPENDRIELVTTFARQYIATVLEAQRNPNKQPSEEAISHPEISSGLEKFRRDYPKTRSTAFLIMQFQHTKPHQEIANVIKGSLLSHGITGLRADDKQYMDDLFLNIQVYMHACDFGIAVFDRITEEDFNPNVSLEVGYMLGMGKNVLLLKDRTLKSLSTDLTGRLYREFDTTDVPATAPNQIEKWLVDKGYTEATVAGSEGGTRE